MGVRVAAAIVGLIAASAPAPAKEHHHFHKPAAQNTAAKSAHQIVKSDPENPLATPTSFSAEAVGWRLIEDSATGARLGLPEKLVPHTGAASRGGSRWTSAQGQIQVETFRLSEAALPALFEEEKTVARRQVGSSELKHDSFTISGAQGLKNFRVRADARGSEVRGITILYDQATEGTMDRVAAAMTNAFDGFPDPKAGPLPGMRPTVEYATAIVVGSAGDLIAPAHVTDECLSISIPPLGHAERVAVDRSDDLALLRLYGARNLVPAPLAEESGPSGKARDLTLVGVADPLAQAGGADVTSAKTRLTAQGIAPAPMPGFSGAAAVAANGSWIGIVDVKSSVVAAGDSSASQGATLIPVPAIRAFLQARGIAPVGASERGAIERSVVRIVCVRK